MTPIELDVSKMIEMMDTAKSFKSEHERRHEEDKWVSHLLLIKKCINSLTYLLSIIGKEPNYKQKKLILKKPVAKLLKILKTLQMKSSQNLYRPQEQPVNKLQ